MMDRELRSIAPRVVLSFLVASLLLSLAFGYFVYIRYIRYAPHASAYLPKDAFATLWLDVEQGVVYAPFREHFLELLEAGHPGPESRLLHFERKTTIELGVDTRELALAWGPGDGFTAAVGGMFRRDGVVEGAARMLRDEGLPASVRADGNVLELGSRAFFSAEADGVLLFRDRPPGGEPPVVVPEPPGRAALIFCWVPTGGSRTCIEVETESDFPFRVVGASPAEWPTVLDPRHATGLLQGLAEPAEGTPRIRGSGTLGRAGFDALLESLADSFAERVSHGFDRAPAAR